MLGNVLLDRLKRACSPIRHLLLAGRTHPRSARTTAERNVCVEILDVMHLSGSVHSIRVRIDALNAPTDRATRRSPTHSAGLQVSSHRRIPLTILSSHMRFPPVFRLFGDLDCAGHFLIHSVQKSTTTAPLVAPGTRATLPGNPLH